MTNEEINFLDMKEQVPKTFKGRGNMLNFRYEQLMNRNNRYLYKVTSPYTESVFFQVFTGTKYPDSIQNIYDFEEAEKIFNQG